MTPTPGPSALQLMYVLVPAEELQDVYDIISRRANPHVQWEPVALKMMDDLFWGMTECLLEKHSPRFKGGEAWDNRRGARC